MNSTNTFDIQNLLNNFIHDTENPENNYKLGEWYYMQGHTSSASTYYIRAAERTEDKLLAYKSLIRASFCYKQQGSRDCTEKILLENALITLPNRPEAYYFLSILYEKKHEWQNCYIYSTLGLRCYDNYDLKPINIAEYPGKYILIFQKAISSWWWGKGDETRNLLLDLWDNYWNLIDINYQNLIKLNAEQISLKLTNNVYQQDNGEQKNMDKIIIFDKHKINSIDCSYAIEYGSQNKQNLHLHVFNENCEKEPYKLYTFLSKQFNDSIILDIGSCFGNSAISLAYNPTNQVISYDLQDLGASAINKKNIVWKIMNFMQDKTIDYTKVSLIFIDVDPHDGKQEPIMIQYLKNIGWSGFILFDDIYINPEMEKLWNSFYEEQRYDLTHLGHWSGTGLIKFNS